MSVCVPVCVRAARDLPGAITEAVAAGADLIELRLDCLTPGELAHVGPHVAAALAARTIPFILTFRPREQGGQHANSFSLEDRLALRAAAPWPDGCELFDSHFEDLELDLVEHLLARGAKRDWSRVICSHHDFAGVPADLEAIYERMAATPARVLKLAVRAADVSDCVPVFRLLERAWQEKRACVAVAMGEAGLLTRVLGPARGSAFTFGALDGTRLTAPGQIAASELKGVYRAGELNEATKLFGLVGAPVVAHTLSPHMHNAAFRALGMNAVYVPLEVCDLADFERRVAHPRTRELAWGPRGFGVTAPHKRAMLDHLDRIDDAAREIGAVNTVVVDEEEGTLTGCNTDANGFVAPLLAPGHFVHLRGANVAVLGAGGAARAVLWSLRRHGASASVFARDARAAEALASEFGAASANQLAGARLNQFEVVVNATPLGTRGTHEFETPATAAQLRGAGLVYDLVYNPAETRLLREARDAGCRTLNGLPMLVAQAEEQLKLWSGRAAPPGVMRSAAERALSDWDAEAAAATTTNTGGAE